MQRVDLYLWTVIIHVAAWRYWSCCIFPFSPSVTGNVEPTATGSTMVQCVAKLSVGEKRHHTC